MVAAAWWRGRMAGFDLETTSADPEEARLVSAAIALCGGGEPTAAESWLADPGVEIPEEAAGIHGITTEIARRKGRPLDGVLHEVVERLVLAVEMGWPLVIFNAPYDLTVLDRECRRHGVLPLVDRPVAGRLRVIDPLVLDKHLDRYRRGSRKLDAICGSYGLAPFAPHAAAADAVTACRAAWVIGEKGTVIRRVRNGEEAEEKAALLRHWSAVRSDLDRLHEAQALWSEYQQLGLADYFREQGKHEDADRVRLAWPVVPLVAA